MGGSGRGDRLEIGTCIERSIDSELSGNIIDLCPVGALTNKPFRFSARAWELTAKPTQAAHDAVCSTLYYHHRQGRILRSVPRPNEARNETWLSDRDRFSHFGLYAEDRVLEPRVRSNGEWHTVGWDEGIAAAAAALREAGESLNVMMGASSASEDYFLAQRVSRGLGSNNIDHRLREQDFSDDAARQTSPRFARSVAGMQQADALLLLGSNIRHEAPILGHRVRKAWRAGASVSAINPIDWDFHFDLRHKLIVPPQQMLGQVAALALAVSGVTGRELPEQLAQCAMGGAAEQEHRDLAQALVDARDGTILLGHFAHAHPQAAALRQLAGWIAEAADVALNMLPFGANPVGAWLAGALPHRGPGGTQAGPGRNAAEMQASGNGNFLLWDFEPEFDVGNPAGLLQSLRGAGKVIAVTSFASAELEEVADIILPLAPLAESEGTLHNIDGSAMTLQPAGRICGDAKPGWKILRRLGAELGLEGFGQVDLASLQSEMEEAMKGEADPVPGFTPVTAMEASLYRVGEIPMYAVDGLCRRSPPLQESSHAEVAYIGLNAADISALGLTVGERAVVSQGGARIQLPVRELDRVPPGAAWMAGATLDAREFNALVAPLSVEKA